MQSKTTKRSGGFILGTIIAGATYHFTGLPTFRTEAAAREYIKTQPRNGIVYVWQVLDCYRLGVNYGTDYRLCLEAV